MDDRNFIMKPKVDFCFKELMEDRIIRRGFVSALLRVSPEEIEDIELLPTILRQEHEEDRLGILDVRVKLKSGTQINMEMQVASFPEWEKRTLFYLCKMFTDQLHKGDSYEKLKKCIHVGLLDFILFEDIPEYYSRFHIWEDTRRCQYSDELEIHVLEFPKLKKYDDPTDELMKWAKFFNAENEEEFEMLARENDYLNRAYEKLQEISSDEQKRLEYDAREKAIRDHEWLMRKSQEFGFNKGYQDGKEAGFQDGIEAGFQDGKEAGFQDGREAGFRDGKEAGFRDGKEAGFQDGREAGFRDGREAGFQEGIQEGMQEGKATAICDLLGELSPVPDNLKKAIYSEKNPDVLKKWLSIAAKAESIDQFKTAMKDV